jgi:hypothetical protein
MQQKFTLLSGKFTKKYNWLVSFYKMLIGGEKVFVFVKSLYLKRSVQIEHHVAKHVA